MVCFEKKSSFRTVEIYQIHQKENRVIIRKGKKEDVILSYSRFYYSEIQARQAYEKMVAAKEQDHFWHLREEPPREVLPAVLPLPRYEALEQAINDNIENKEAWLIYADWLQMHGDPRGEHIFLERSLKSFDIQTRSQVRQQIYNFKRQYFAYLDPLFLEGMLYDGLHVLLSWKSGFIISAAWDWCTVSFPEAYFHAFVQSPASIFLQKLKWTTVHNTYLNDNVIALPIDKILLSFPQLKHLSIEGQNPITAMHSSILQSVSLGYAQLFGLSQSQLPALKKLCIDLKIINREKHYLVGLEKALQQDFPALKELMLISQRRGEASYILQLLAWMPITRKLEKLILNIYLTDQDASLLADLKKNLLNIKVLNFVIGDNAITYEGMALLKEVFDIAVLRTDKYYF